MGRPLKPRDDDYRRPERRECARLRNLGLITLREARFADLQIPIAEYALFADARKCHINERGISVTARSHIISVSRVLDGSGRNLLSGKQGHWSSWLEPCRAFRFGGHLKC